MSSLPLCCQQVLRSLLDEEEFAQISAFPSVLRLMVGTDFLSRLEAAGDEELGWTTRNLLRNPLGTV